MKKKPKKNKAITRNARTLKTSVGFMPVGDRVLVKPMSAEEGQTTSFGIIIPDTAKEKPEQGKVVAVGPGKYDDGVLIPVGVSVGDKIMFNKYGYEEIKINGVEYFIVSEANILGILN
jgi:chaperonin GroES